MKISHLFRLKSLRFNTDREQKVKLPAFTLLEVLIAGGVLFIVSAATVGLNNSIVQGTANNAVKTIANRWSSEGLELVGANRDSNLLQTNVQSGQPLWFTPILDPTAYGWYKLSQVSNQWQVQKVTGAANVLNLSAFTAPNAESLTSQSLTAFRLICVEAVGAATQKTDTTISCNTNASGQVIASDGSRSNTASCEAADTYCNNSQPSLNRNALTGSSARIIPAGNAIKIRAVVVWQSKNTYQVSDIATLLTNWRGFEQL